MVVAMYRRWWGLNPGYLLILCAATMVLALFLPWAVVVAPRSPGIMMLFIGRTTLTGWQLHGELLSLAALGVATCGVIYLRDQAGLRTKGLLIAFMLASVLIATFDLGDAVGRLTAVRAAFGDETEGSGIGIGVVIEVFTIVVLVLGTLRAVGWRPGDTASPSAVMKQSLTRLEALLRYGWRRDLTS